MDIPPVHLSDQVNKVRFELFENFEFRKFWENFFSNSKKIEFKFEIRNSKISIRNFLFCFRKRRPIFSSTFVRHELDSKREEIVDREREMNLKSSSQNLEEL